MVVNNFIPYYTFVLDRRLSSLPIQLDDNGNPISITNYYYVYPSDLNRKYKVFYFNEFLSNSLLDSVFWNNERIDLFISDFVSLPLNDLIICPSIGYTANTNFSFLLVEETKSNALNQLKQVFRVNKETGLYEISNLALDIEITYQIHSPAKTIPNIPYSISGNNLSITWPQINCEHDYTCFVNLESSLITEIGFVEVYNYNSNQLAFFSNVFYNDVSIPTQYSSSFSFPFSYITPFQVYVFEIYPTFRSQITRLQGNNTSLVFY